MSVWIEQEEFGKGFPRVQGLRWRVSVSCPTTEGGVVPRIRSRGDGSELGIPTSLRGGEEGGTIGGFVNRDRIREGKVDS